MAVAPDHATLDEPNAVRQANPGHPGTPTALAAAACTVFTRVMEDAPEDPTWPDRDRFVVSARHAPSAAAVSP